MHTDHLLARDTRFTPTVTLHRPNPHTRPRADLAVERLGYQKAVGVFLRKHAIDLGRLSLGCRNNVHIPLATPVHTLHCQTPGRGLLGLVANLADCEL